MEQFTLLMMQAAPLSMEQWLAPLLLLARLWQLRLCQLPRMASRPVAQAKEAFPTLGDVATCFYKEWVRERERKSDTKESVVSENLSGSQPANTNKKAQLVKNDKGAAFTSHGSEVAICDGQKLCSRQVSCEDSGDDMEDEYESDHMSIAETSVRMDLYSLGEINFFSDDTY